jgi:hypothetical protein
MTTETKQAQADPDHFSFADLVQAKFEAAENTRKKTIDVGAVSRAFTTRYGPIVLSRFGGNVPCGVALTDLRAAANPSAAMPVLPTSGGWWPWHGFNYEKRLLHAEERRPVHLHLFFPPLESTDLATVEALSRCEKQAVYARRFLQDEDLRQCLTLLYWPTDALIAQADTETAPVQAAPAANANQPQATGRHSEPASLRDVINDQIDTADQYYQYFTQRSVRLQYFRGIGIGMLALTVLCLVLYGFRTQLGVSVSFLWSVGAGALGALTSVLSSATFGRIVLDRPQGGTWNTMLGVFRPVIGALFGVAFFALVNADFLPIKIPSGGGKVALYASIAFLAGFSHRWAQDTLKAAERRIPAPPTAPDGLPAPATENAQGRNPAQGS